MGASSVMLSLLAKGAFDSGVEYSIVSAHCPTKIYVVEVRRGKIDAGLAICGWEDRSPAGGVLCLQ